MGLPILGLSANYLPSKAKSVFKEKHFFASRFSCLSNGGIVTTL
ncbi:MAG: hypothetical protein FD181_1504 [Prolixibacteraceae bacterium]|nr:MAG: hypothetical protein FD181_1504 [Prolixibacteraceae bacterium]